MQEKTPLPVSTAPPPPPPPPAAETLNAVASAEKQELSTSCCPALPVSVPKICYNRECGKICGGDNRSSNSWPGWRLHSGRVADLCQYCSLLYEQFQFCKVFHSDDSGWRACNSCQKKVHCGCIASLYAFSLLDTGGIECADCARKSNNLGMVGDRNKPYACIPSTSHETNSDQKAWPEYVGPHVLHCGTDSRPWLPFPIQRFPSASQSDLPIFWHTTEVDRNQEIDRVAEKSPGEMLSAFDSNKVDGDSNDRMKNANMKFESVRGGFGLDVERTKENSEKTQLLKEGGRDKFIQISSGHGDSYGDFDNHEHTSEVENERGSEALQLLASKTQDVAKDEVEPSLTTDHLIMSLGIFPARNGATESNDHIEAMSTSLGLASSIGVDGDTKEHAKTSGLNLIRPKQRQLLPKPLQTHLSARVDVPKEVSSQPSIRVARPPGEGRGRNQLLPRYWPRITEQELQQIVPGDSNSTITALFEKMLSASDAGRIGRLVLPKACAEAYFPSISQPEGVPLNIQDVSGKEWVFQFRFWPNNNSRMYVLEGVTPCIQSMQLQAGDTVTFSRLDPEGKLIMGYRRAPPSLSSQDNQPSTAGMVLSPASLPVNSGGLDSVSNLSKLSALLSQTVKGVSEPQINAVLGQLKESSYGWSKPEKVATKSKENTSLEPLISEKRRGRNLGSKSKRLRLEVEDSIELKLSWEEMQELLRPPPNVNPSIVTIEGHEFEEYEDPPVFGKRTILTARQHGPGEDQWAQCDDCGSWRKVPSDVFLPTRWTCVDNVWDQKRAACSAPQEVDSEDINNLLHQTKGQKKVEVSEKPEMVNDAASGLDTLANAATLGENVTTSFPSPGPTTRHPRHRPGCTCIVCIQPPSGKGPKHKSTCVCNVCTTVKRRFKTLMMRRKKRQSEREAETARKKCLGIRDEGEISSTSGGMKWKTETYPFLVENGLRHEDNLIGGYVSQHSFSFGPHKVNQTSKPVRIAVVEELLGNKGHIDLNSQPDREEETKKSSGRISMLRLLQIAKSPLDSYLKQHGFTNLFLPPQMLIPPTIFSRDLDDPNSCHLTIDQPPERIQDEAVFWLNQAKADQGVASIQGQGLSEPKSSLLKSSET